MINLLWNLFMIKIITHVNYLWFWSYKLNLLERFFSRVDPEVDFECFSLREAFLADFTLERSLVPVVSLVALQVALGSERSVAPLLRTFKWPVTSVGPHVSWIGKHKINMHTCIYIYSICNYWQPDNYHPDQLSPDQLSPHYFLWQSLMNVNHFRSTQLSA